MRVGTYLLKVRAKKKCNQYLDKNIRITIKPKRICNKDVWFISGKHNSKYNPGDDLVVKMEAGKSADIVSMELFVNNIRINKKTRALFEWNGRQRGETRLRNIQKGTYQIKVVVKTKYTV